MKCHRLTLKERGEAKEEVFSGKGGLFNSARWHQQGRPIIYCAQHLSLAALEVRVHTDNPTDLADYVAWTIEVPDELILDHTERGIHFPDTPARTADEGTKWLKENASVGLKVPSVIIPEEYNILFNPSHPEWHNLFPDWPVSGPKEFYWDMRLF